MKHHSILMLPIFLFTTLLLGQQKGTVTIVSKPEKCWVRIDSVLVGKTPIQQFSLAPGEHTIQVFPNNNGIWNVQERIFHLTIKAHHDTTIDALFSRPVYINSVPFGANLLYDSTNIGRTPLYIPFEENKGKQFELVKTGYKPYFFTLDTTHSIFARLEPEEATTKVSKPQLLGFIPKRRLKSKFTLLALTVAAHWASFYFKNQADENFDRYNRTTNPKLMDRYWNRTRKFDRLSAISLGVSYASLAGLAYMVIWK